MKSKIYQFIRSIRIFIEWLWSKAIEAGTIIAGILALWGGHYVYDAALLDIKHKKEIQFEHREKLQAFLHGDLNILEKDIEYLLEAIEAGTEVKMLILMGAMESRPLIKENELDYIDSLTEEQAWLVAVIDFYLFKLNEYVLGIKTVALMHPKTASSGFPYNEKNIESIQKALGGIKALKSSLRNNDSKIEIEKFLNSLGLEILLVEGD